MSRVFFHPLNISATFCAHKRAQRLNFSERLHGNIRLYPHTQIIIASPLTVMTGSSPCLQVWLFAIAINNFVFWSGRTTRSMSFQVRPAFSLSVWVSDDSSLPLVPDVVIECLILRGLWRATSRSDLAAKHDLWTAEETAHQKIRNTCSASYSSRLFGASCWTVTLCLWCSKCPKEYVRKAE